MLNSREVDLLRPDVAANCRIFVSLMKEAGHDVLVTGTVRDHEYQRSVFEAGYAGTPTPSFHSITAGLAFDVCKNRKGGEYSDMAFWRAAGRIGKKLGFTWGGDWATIKDRPHFQWSDHGKYRGSDILAGRLPPAMPLYQKEEDDMAKLTDAEFADYMARYLSAAGTGDAPSPWAKEAAAALKAAGVINGDGQGNYGWQKPITRETAAVLLYNMKRTGGLSNG